MPSLANEKGQQLNNQGEIAIIEQAIEQAIEQTIEHAIDWAIAWLRLEMAIYIGKEVTGIPDAYVGQVKNQLRDGFGVYQYANKFFRYEGNKM